MRGFPRRAAARRHMLVRSQPGAVARQSRRRSQAVVPPPLAEERGRCSPGRPLSAAAAAEEVAVAEEGRCSLCSSSSLLAWLTARKRGGAARLRFTARRRDPVSTESLLNVSLFHTWGYSNGKLDAWLLVVRRRRDIIGRGGASSSLRPAARWPHAEASLLATVVSTTMEVASNVKESSPWKPELLAPKLRRSPAMAARQAQCSPAAAARWGVVVRRLEVSSSKANELPACICCSRVVNEVRA
ncbi:hypothetical protein Dimus_015284 [Dionaea muscipula]